MQCLNPLKIKYYGGVAGSEGIWLHCVLIHFWTMKELYKHAIESFTMQVKLISKGIAEIIIIFNVNNKYFLNRLIYHWVYKISGQLFKYITISIL